MRKRGDAESLEAEGSERLEPVIVDVTDEGTIAATRERIEEVTGGRLAGLVNNAGIVVGGPLETLDLDGLRRQLEVNVTGQVAVTQAILPMIRAARGRIVLMASVGGRMSLPYLSPYHASKFAPRGGRRLAADGDAPVRRRASRSSSRARSRRRSGSKGTDQIEQVLATMSPAAAGAL